MLPVSIVVFVAALVYLRFTLAASDAKLDQAAGFVHDELQRLGPIRGEEKWCLFLFACPLVLAFTRGA